MTNQNATVRENDSVMVTRLTLGDLPQIGGLLRETWPQSYGATGCPNFSDAYLEWLYGGPDAERHLLLGAFQKDRLVGFKAYLHRRLRLNGHIRTAHIATHLTIGPGLSFGERMALMADLARLHTLEPGHADLESEALVAFFDQNKPITRSFRALATGFNLWTVTTSFAQALLNPMALRNLPEAGSPRRCTPEDAPRMAKLLAATPGDPGLASSPATLWYHLSQAPGAAIFGVERDGRLEAFLGCYILDWLKAGRVSRVCVVELVAAASLDMLAPLFKAASEHAAASGARGVSMENPTCLPDETARALGLMTTPRQMTLSIRSHVPDLHIEDGFICDIK